MESDRERAAREQVRKLADQLRATSPLFGAPPTQPARIHSVVSRPASAPIEPLPPARGMGDVMAEIDATMQAEIAADRERIARDAEAAQRERDFAPLHEIARRFESAPLDGFHQEVLDETMASMREKIEAAREAGDRAAIEEAHEWLRGFSGYLGSITE